MFESAELGSTVDKDTFAQESARIREDLLAVQRELAATPLSVVVIVGGVEGAGKSDIVDRLLQWMDARGIEVHAMWDTTDEERERPPLWRFWRILPRKRHIGIFFGSWYTAPIIDRVFERTSQPELDVALDRINDLETMLTNEDTVVIKFWLHLAKDVQKKRLKALSKSKKNAWRVTPMDWEFFKLYDQFRSVSEYALARTSTGRSPWHIVEGADRRFRTLAVTKTLQARLRRAIDDFHTRPNPDPEPDRPVPAEFNLLRSLDLTQKLEQPEYDRQVTKYAGRINILQRRLHDERKGMILVFEGPDAAGKGGAIRHLTSALDARNYQVISIAAPTDEELARPYLWRFWRHLPRLGRVTIFDRSWYGRVLVERIEGFCRREDWQRAYAEINAFEKQLTDFGLIVVKFWLEISGEEQLRRFVNRQTTPYKQYKITEEDWRNRAKQEAYEAAACEMIEKTSSEQAPWVLVEAEDKNFARVKVMRTVYGALKQAMR